MNYKAARKQHQQILKEIYNCSAKPHVTETTGVLRTILDFSESEARRVPLGPTLRSFASVADLAHPDLGSIFGGQLTSDESTSFNRIAKDVLKLQRMAIEAEISTSVWVQLAAAVERHPSYSDIAVNLGCPVQTLRHLRFVQDKGRRTRLRKKKGTQGISLSWSVKKQELAVDQLPSDLSSYARNVSRHALIMEEAEERKRHLLAHGLKFMAGEVEKGLKTLKEQSEAEMYYGFQKISISVAAAVLCKMSGYGIHPMSDSVWVAVNPLEVFGVDFTSGNQTVVEASPTIFPLHEFEKEMPPGTKKLIRHLESFPETGGKPLFDHYRVIVPSLLYPSYHITPPFEFEFPGLKASFPNTEQARDALGKQLLKRCHILGALVGERDGEHYFINYWMW